MSKKVINNKSIDFQVFDVHIHFGEYKGHFFAPESINETLTFCGVHRFSVMLFPNKLNLNTERDKWLNTKILEQNSSVDLLLVVSPELLMVDDNLSILDTLPYKMIKLHGALHSWHPNGKAIRKVFQIAKGKHIPIMLHTGGREKSDAGSYLNICADFPEVRVILAHSRPFDETLKVMKMCPNVWADTSFLPIEKVKLFDREGLIDRVLFGTDFPIATYFSNETNPQTWYDKTISKMMAALGVGTFKIISNVNYINFYHRY